MKKLSTFIITTAMVLSPATVLAISQNAQGQSSDNSNGSSQSSSQGTSGSQGTSSSGNGNDVQTQNQLQTSNQGEDTQLQLSQEIQTKLSEVQDTYSAGNAAAKQGLANTSAAAEKLIELSASIENETVAAQLQSIAKAQVDATNEISKSIDKAESKNGFVKFFTGADYKQIKAANQQMEQNRQRIQELNQIKAQIENSADATALQNQINVLEAQNTSLQDQVNQLEGGFSLFGWLFKWFN